jgi:hypothetical protein
MVFCGAGGVVRANATDDPSSTATPAPPSPGDCCWASDSALQGMALTIRAEGGGADCIIGLNCGRINPTRPPPVTNPPRLAPRQ